MPHVPFRFLVSSDWRLQSVACGLGEIADSWRMRLIEAPFEAARAVIDTAIDQGVDFVVLAGDVLHAGAAGPRGLAFVGEQLQRLAERRIAVFWCGGTAEALGPWPEQLAMPTGVRTFSNAAWQTHVAVRDGAPLARLVGRSIGQRDSATAAVSEREHWLGIEAAGVGSTGYQLPKDLPALAPAAAEDGLGLLTIVVAHGEAQTEGWTGRGVALAALGGQTQRRLLPAPNTLVLWPGTPQGRSWGESGPHGASVVHVDEQGLLRVLPAPADKLRWHDEQCEISAALSDEDILRLLTERTAALVAGNGGLDALVRWTLVVERERNAARYRNDRVAEWLARLRSQFATARPAAWTSGIDVHFATALAADAIAADTVLARYLANLQALAATDSIPPALAALAGSPQRATAVGLHVDWDRQQRRQKAIGGAAQLGLELLQPPREGQR